MDHFVKQNNIDYIDYLKIDVEGFEYEVLEGAKSILNNTGVIYVETCFIPFRKNQKLFSHVDVLLRDFNFDLVHHEVLQAQLGYKVLTEPTHYIPPFFFDPHGQPLSCDSIYINTAMKDPERCLAQAMILLANKYIDAGLFILKNKTQIEEDYFDLLSQTSLYFGRGERFRLKGYQLVDYGVAKLRSITKKFGI